MNPQVLVYNKQERLIKKMFDSLAKYYDFANHLFTFNLDRNWRKEIAIKVAKYNPKLILDIATGSGDVAILLSKYTNAKIIGIDISREMLNKAQEKIRKENVENRITFLQQNAENTSFESSSFDMITSVFGIRNFHDYRKGLLEAYRLLNNNGKIIIAEFSEPQNKVIKSLYKFYLKLIMPFISSALFKKGKAYKYFYNSILNFPKDEEFCNILKEIGFKDVKYEKKTLGILVIYEATKLI